MVPFEIGLYFLIIILTTLPPEYGFAVPDVVFADGFVHRYVYGAAKPAQQPAGESSRGGPGICRMAHLYKAVFFLCGVFFQLLQYLRLCVCGGTEYAVALFLHFHCVLWRRAESPADAGGGNVIFL